MTSRPIPRAFWVAPVIVVAVAIFGMVVVHTRVFSWENGVSTWLTERRFPVLSEVALAIAIGFSPLWAVVLTLITATILTVAAGGTWTRRALVALRFLSLVLAGWAAAAIVKPIVARPRPGRGVIVHPIAPETGTLSFPSGHTAFAAGFFFALVVTVVSLERRTAALVIAALLVIVVASSRVHVGAHFVTDVTAGAIAGATGVWLAHRAWGFAAPGRYTLDYRPRHQLTAEPREHTAPREDTESIGTAHQVDTLPGTPRALPQSFSIDTSGE